MAAHPRSSRSTSRRSRATRDSAAPGDLTKLKKVPTFNELDAVAENRSVYTDGTLAGAIYFMTPPSRDYVLEHLTPQLEKAVAGEAPQKVGAG